MRVRETKSVKELMANPKFLERLIKPQKYITTEFQNQGLVMAQKLNDLKHKSLYIKMCKHIPRFILEDAESFASDYPKSKNKGRVFMWKVNELCKIHNLDIGFLFGKFKKKSAPTQTKQLKLF